MVIEEKKKVLIVDDTPQNIQILMAILEDQYSIIAARNGRKAISLAQKQPQPDIILLDVMMPELDGYEVCRQLKAEPSTRDIPVVFVSALSDYDDEEKGLAVGGIDYLIKPINPAIVLARIKNHIALREAKSALQDQNETLRLAARLREDVDMITRHDLKSPLNVILAYPDIMLAEGGLSERQVLALNKIQSAGYRMLKMINHSLDLYKMEEGTYALHASPVNLVDVLLSVMAEEKKLCSGKAVSIRILMHGKPLPAAARFMIYGEELLCHTLFSNLIKNALEASPQGKAVTICLEQRGGQAVISLHNEGAVPLDMTHCFFDKHTTSGKHNGTGLGTYSARLNAEVQNGRIAMRSTEQDGTTLTVSLPLPPE